MVGVSWSRRYACQARTREVQLAVSIVGDLLNVLEAPWVKAQKPGLLRMRFAQSQQAFSD